MCTWSRIRGSILQSHEGRGDLLTSVSPLLMAVGLGCLHWCRAERYSFPTMFLESEIPPNPGEFYDQGERPKSSGLPLSTEMLVWAGS